MIQLDWKRWHPKIEVSSLLGGQLFFFLHIYIYMIKICIFLVLLLGHKSCFPSQSSREFRPCKKERCWPLEYDQYRDPTKDLKCCSLHVRPIVGSKTLQLIALLTHPVGYKKTCVRPQTFSLHNEKEKCMSRSLSFLWTDNEVKPLLYVNH